MALASWIFALSPNLLAHGSLATMEMPLVAASNGAFWSFWRFLDTRRERWLWSAAALAGLAFSCKFTAILFPPIFCRRVGCRAGTMQAETATAAGGVCEKARLGW